MENIAALDFTLAPDEAGSQRTQGVQRMWRSGTGTLVRSDSGIVDLLLEDDMGLFQETPVQA